MFLNKKIKQIDLKLEQLRLFESKIQNLIGECKLLLDNAINKEKKLTEQGISLNHQLEAKVAEIEKAEELVKNSSENAKKILREKDIALNHQNEVKKQELYVFECGLRKIFDEKSKGLPWLADAISELYRLYDVDIAEYLEFKNHPAPKKAEKIRQISEENRLLRKKAKITESYINNYETLFPWLADYRDNSLTDLLEELEKVKDEEKINQDPVLKYIPRSEFNKLPEEERNQKALDRFVSSRKKASWQLGRDYERYIGYLYELKGYKVQYEGIIKGFEDLGRDLICTRDNDIEIVQCKYWAHYKQIHEKHINQLFGTFVQFFIEHNEESSQKRQLQLFPELIKSGKIKPVFVTSTTLTETASKFASVLGITVIQKQPLEEYPMIKCNIALDGEKIYHLPFDQQYDKTVISKQGEFYAWTVKDAMKSGFRRAWRWSGNREENKRN